MNIDWKLLKKQKETLCNVIHDNRHNEMISDDLDGILYLIDALQDELEPKEQEEQETKQSNATAWDFVEKYYPNYSSSDQICRALDLLLKKETEELNSEEDIEITYILEDVYEQAIANFIKINGGI